MKNTIIIALLILVACKQAKREGQVLPDFDLLLVDSVTKLNTASIPEGHPVVLLYFSPDCEHCQKETEGILKKMDSLQHVQFYFITNDSLVRLQVYNYMYKLYKYPNITLGRDYKYFFPAHFKDAAPPTMVIYDKDKMLVTIIKGEIDSSQIMSSISNINTY